MTYRFGFTGTQNGMTSAQKQSFREYLLGGSGEFHHGDCVGSDAEAHVIAIESGYCPVLHPPTNYSKRAWCEVPAHLMRTERSYLDRNRNIVDETIALIAAPAEFDEQPRGGTWYTVRYGRKKGRPIVLIFPDGAVKQTSHRASATHSRCAVRDRLVAFHGRVSIEPGDAGHDNYCGLLAGGYDVLVYFDGREEKECVAADPNEGWIAKHRHVGWTVIRDVINGRVEIKLRARRQK